jgi:hypothetical protein
MTADVLFSYLFGMDWFLLSGFALIVAAVAGVELGRVLWATNAGDEELVPLAKVSHSAAGSLLSSRH